MSTEPAPLAEDDETVCPACHYDKLTIAYDVGGYGIWCQDRWHDRHPDRDLVMLRHDSANLRNASRLGMVLARFERWAGEQDQTVLLGSCAYVDKRWTVTISHGVMPNVHTHRGRGRELSTAYLMLLKDLEVIT